MSTRKGRHRSTDELVLEASTRIHGKQASYAQIEAKALGSAVASNLTTELTALRESRIPASSPMPPRLCGNGMSPRRPSRRSSEAFGYPSTGSMRGSWTSQPPPPLTSRQRPPPVPRRGPSGAAAPSTPLSAVA